MFRLCFSLLLLSRIGGGGGGCRKAFYRIGGLAIVIVEVACCLLLSPPGVVGILFFCHGERLSTLGCRLDVVATCVGKEEDGSAKVQTVRLTFSKVSVDPFVATFCRDNDLTVGWCGDSVIPGRVRVVKAQFFPRTVLGPN